MAQILYGKEKKVYVEDIDREVTIQKSKFYYLEKTDRDFSCIEGAIKKENLTDSEITTSTGKEFFSFPSTFYDDYRHMKRGAQIITPKDIGIIITEGGICKDSIVVEGGSGSGALSCYLGKIAKKVYSYDINEENQAIAKLNTDKLNLDNVEFKLKSMYESIDEKEVDAVIMDLPEPWEALENAKNSVKVGGIIIGYCPTVSQISNFVEAVKKDKQLHYHKTIELIQRKWKVKGLAVRPVSESIGHTAFLVFVRRVN
ncbi:methyltransferase domain-containing protein [Candidatus Woesearchaeota archaeon]|nr:methyltransferase domain-containing protein [Candidatus Woesearchaeota archaeon]